MSRIRSDYSSSFLPARVQPARPPSILQGVPATSGLCAESKPLLKEGETLIVTYNPDPALSSFIPPIPPKTEPQFDPRHEPEPLCGPTIPSDLGEMTSKLASLDRIRNLPDSAKCGCRWYTREDCQNHCTSMNARPEDTYIRNRLQKAREGVWAEVTKICGADPDSVPFTAGCLQRHLSMERTEANQQGQDKVRDELRDFLNLQPRKPVVKYPNLFPQGGTLYRYKNRDVFVILGVARATGPDKQMHIICQPEDGSMNVVVTLDEFRNGDWDYIPNSGG